MKKNRMLSVMIAIAMVLSLMPAMAFAEDSKNAAKVFTTNEAVSDYHVYYIC